LNVLIFVNFVFSDTPSDRLSVVVTARNDRAVAEALASAIATMAWDMRHRFVRSLTPIVEAVPLATTPNRAPVIFSDVGDNPGGGGSGRTTKLIAALHIAGARNVCYGPFADPELAQETHDRGIGATFTARFNRSAMTHGSSGTARSRP
jgi:microcystin degradation protein MlrC